MTKAQTKATFALFLIIGGAQAGPFCTLDEHPDVDPIGWSVSSCKNGQDAGRIPKRLPHVVRPVHDCLFRGPNEVSHGMLAGQCGTVPTILKRGFSPEALKRQRESVEQVFKQTEPTFYCDIEDGEGRYKTREARPYEDIFKYINESSPHRCWAGIDDEWSRRFPGVPLSNNSGHPEFGTVNHRVLPWQDTVFFGGGEALANLHFDTMHMGQYHVMLYGRKRWLVFNHKMGAALYASPLTGANPTFYFKKDMYMDACELKTRWPALEYAEYYDFIVEAGDIVWIPAGSFHAVEYLEPGAGYNYIIDWGKRAGLENTLRRRVVPKLHKLFDFYRTHAGLLNEIFPGPYVNLVTDGKIWFPDWALKTFPLANGWSFEFHNRLRMTYLVACQPLVHSALAFELAKQSALKVLSFLEGGL